MLSVTIYLIKNTATDRYYVGQSQRPKRRMRSHKTSLIRGRHDNKLLQSDWNKFGEEYFSFQVLSSVPFGDHYKVELRTIITLVLNGYKVYNMDAKGEIITAQQLESLFSNNERVSIQQLYEMYDLSRAGGI